MKKLFAATAIALALNAGAISLAFASDEVNTTRGTTMSGVGLAVHGYDAVSFFGGTPVLGDAKFETTFNGAAYRFETQANLDTFKASPEKYAPQFGGFCAMGVTAGKKLDGDPKFWKVVDNKLYLNVAAGAQAAWQKDIPGNISKADEKWVGIKSTAPDKL